MGLSAFHLVETRTVHRHLAVGYLPTNIDLVCLVTTTTLYVCVVVFRTFYS